MRKNSILICLFLTTLSAYAQVDKNSNLYKTILSKDSLLFNIGFNTCDISQFENLLSEKFEFFHDKDSISYKKEFLYNLRNGLCKSPTTHFPIRVSRMLVANLISLRFWGKTVKLKMTKKEKRIAFIE